VTHPAEEEYRKFLPEFKADLQFIPDDNLKQFKNGQFLICLKHQQRVEEV
jgi:hypothetical protein